VVCGLQSAVCNLQSAFSPKGGHLGAFINGSEAKYCSMAEIDHDKKEHSDWFSKGLDIVTEKIKRSQHWFPSWLTSVVQNTFKSKLFVAKEEPFTACVAWIFDRNLWNLIAMKKKLCVTFFFTHGALANRASSVYFAVGKFVKEP